LGLVDEQLDVQLDFKLAGEILSQMERATLSLIEDLTNPEEYRAQHGARCSVCALLETLPADEAQVLFIKMNDPNVTKSAIARILARNGHAIRTGTLTRHARGECLGSVRRSE
jgi:hypothetical protein